jgi:hypothetical protein
MHGACKKRSNRGQFTIFVILGLVIVIIFALMMYQVSRINNMKIYTQADMQIKDYISKNSINQYVTSCLDSVADEAITRAAMQGGVIDLQNKKTREYYDAAYNRSFNVSISVDKNENCTYNPAPNYIVTNDPPLYPYIRGYWPVADLPAQYLSSTGEYANTCTFNYFLYTSGFFGINNMTRLCDRTGNNRLYINSNIFSNPNSRTCDYYNFGSDPSVQKEMEVFIAGEIGKCVNFTDILKRNPTNITFVGNANVNITFGIGGLTVELSYPFTVLMYNRQPVTRMVDFGVEKNVAFKELYEYAYELANMDVADALFHIVNNRSNVISHSPRRRNNNIYGGYDVIQLKGNTTNEYTDIIQVIDRTSQIKGKPLIVNIGIANRRPALDYITDYSSSYYDIRGVENETLILRPQGYDPDQDFMAYTYYAWQETYSDNYNFSNPECEKPTSIEYVIANCSMNISLRDAKWSDSIVYINTLQNASYSPMHNDTGFHKVKITVFDGRGLMDYQIVRVMVFDLPKVNVTGTNNYTDVNETLASYEDIYILDATKSHVGSIAQLFPVTLDTLIWNDTYEPFLSIITPINTPDDMMLYMPNATKTLEPPAVGPVVLSIENIVDYIFNKNRDPAIHNISLTINNTLGFKNTGYIIVNVTQCLNHSNPGNPPYPYNAYPSNLIDALQADHRCCLSNMSYADDSTECYRNEGYGGDNSFIDYRALSYSPPAPYNIRYTPGLAPSYPYDNDIYYRIFTRNCSSNRGNICTGYADESRETGTPDAPSCNDDNLGTDSVERCWGPPADALGINGWENSKTQLPCVSYPAGQTFEIISQTGTSQTGNCNGNNRKCSSGEGSQAYDTAGKYSCIGQCDTDGRCTHAAACTCDSSCGNGAAGECDGLAYPGSKIYDINFARSCNAGNTYVADVCNSCGLVDSSDNICRSAGSLNPTPGADGCSADPQCDTGTNTPNSPIGNNAYCDSTCKYQPCGDFKAYRIAGVWTCYSSPCTASSQCTSGRCCLINNGCTSNGITYNKGDCY